MQPLSFETFTELPISAPVLKAIGEMGFEKPSAIQAQTLPILLGEPTDFLGLAATGTGKTAAFAIPMLERINDSMKSVQSLVLCPTRELALQVTQQINLLGKYKNINAITIYGGASYIDQIRGIKRGAQVVVGTPGRVVDLLDQGQLDFSGLSTLILDEADEMISMGFKDELEKILAASPRESSQIWLFSATMGREVRKVADTYLRSPQQVQINRTEMLPSTVEQYYYMVRESDKPEVLCKLIEAAEDFYGLIFCQTKALVIDLTQYLIERGYKADCLHGDKDQNSRERTMQAFRDRRMNVLICTDVASRGLDVKDITHVINYSLPREMDNYVHRIGRTARSGKTGIAMNLVTPSHRGLIYRIEQFTKSHMSEGKLPTRRDLATKKTNSLLERFKEQNFYTRAIEILSEEWKTTLAEMPAEEVAGRFLTMMMPEIFNDRTAEQKPQIRTETAPRMSPRSEPRNDRAPRFDRSERPQRFDRAPRGDRPSFDRAPRGDRPSYDRTPRGDRPSFDRPERAPRAERPSFDRAPISESLAPAPLIERSERPERAPRGDRPSFDRAPRADRPSFDRPERAPRPEQRSERFERVPRGDRPSFERSERAPRTDRFERAPRAERSEGFDRYSKAKSSLPFTRDMEDRPAMKSPYANKRERSDSDGMAPPSPHPSGLNRKARRAAKFGAEFDHLHMVKDPKAASGGNQPPRRKRD